MTLEEEIADWAATRPAWQRDALRRLALGETLGTDDYRRIAAALVSNDDTEFIDLAVSDMPGSTTSKQRVRLAALRGVDHVNALVAEQDVTFALDGVTVIYGDNGSGKSGYARLVKRMVRSRHREEVLTDIFTDSSQDLPAAQVDLDVDGVAHSSAWPATGSGELRSVTFFDEACGDAYISHESEVTFRPAAIFVLDGLVEACDGVRAELDKLVAENTARTRRLPEVPPGTGAADLVASLSGRSTDEQIGAACGVPPDVDDQIQQLTDEELRLSATDPTRERSRLLALANKYDRVRRHFESLEVVYGSERLAELAGTRRRTADLRAAAQIAAATSFDSEPVPGVGTRTWRALWEAARTYSETEVDHEHDFPVVATGSRCVLCEQELSDEARSRFARFEAVVRDQTEREAADAERQLQVAEQAIASAVVEAPDVLVMLDDLTETDPDPVQACRTALSLYAAARQTLKESGAALIEQLPGVAQPEPPIELLTQRSAEAAATASSLDSALFSQQLKETAAKRADLAARRILHGVEGDLRAEAARRRDRAALDDIKRSTDTTGITRKATELTRAHVTSIIRDRFTRESDRLKLERVTIEDIGGQKGQLRHRPAFVGAVQHPSMDHVLSEGEQTALGLAGFFTEAHLDDSRSAVVLDDPVCSLDHIRRGRVARRLTELAKERQVIVFTHDLTFVVELRLAAIHESVPFTERTVERRGDGKPGVCVDGHPWKSKDTKARLGQLEAELARIKAGAVTSGAEDYERGTADWAGKLSETWERMISLEVVGRVSDLATLEVRPKMFRMLASITTDDDKEFQESYERCSRWARRHDKSPALNYVAPTTAEMEKELAGVRSWYDRIRKYANS